MAIIKVAPEFDLPRIAADAGQSDIEKILYFEGGLEVEGVSQVDLEAALERYDHLETEREKAKVEAIAERDARLSEADKAAAGMADAYIAGLLDEADTTRFKDFAAYKLALRKIDQQAGYPNVIEWPPTPE